MAQYARSFRELAVYQAVFGLQQSIFEASRTWPGEERYSLTDQIRRSSRSIGANIAEAWARGQGFVVLRSSCLVRPLTLRPPPSAS